MSVAYEKLIQHFNENDIRYESDDDAQVVQVMFRGAEAVYRLVLQVAPEERLFQLFAFPPFTVPKGSRPAVAEAVCRANFGLKLGKWELDFEDGELRFQVGHILVEDDLDDPTIRHLIGLSLAMLDRYLPAILSVIYGNELPADAIRFAEA